VMTGYNLRMRWIIWGWALCVALGSVNVVFSQEDEDDDDDEDSAIEVESAPDAEDERAKEDTAPRANATGPITARAKDAKIEWRALADKKKHYQLSVPTDWRIEEAAAGKDSVDFRAVIPGATDSCTLMVRERLGAPPPATLAQSIATQTRDQQPDTRVEQMFETYPMVRVTNGDVTTLWAFLRINGRSFEVGMVSTPSDRTAVRADFLAVVPRITCKRASLPSIPENYKVVKKGRFRVAVHPAVKTKLKPIYSALADQDKRFSKFHGKMPKAAPSPVLFVHVSHSAGVSVYSRLSELTIPVSGDWTGQRLFSLQLPAKNRQQLSAFASGFARFAFVEHYGVTGPEWARVGESNLASLQALGGHKLPTLPPGLAPWSDTTVIQRLDKLTSDYKDRNGEEFRRESF
jgi:hypothetical protein